MSGILVQRFFSSGTANATYISSLELLTRPARVLLAISTLVAIKKNTSGIAVQQPSLTSMMAALSCRQRAQQLPQSPCRSRACHRAQRDSAHRVHIVVSQQNSGPFAHVDEGAVSWCLMYSGVHVGSGVSGERDEIEHATSRTRRVYSAPADILCIRGNTTRQLRSSGLKFFVPYLKVC